jgi:argininosuccinate lyase
MTYNRDLQEDKQRLFDSSDHVRASLRIAAAMMPKIAVNRAACHAAARDPGLLATDLADYLVRKGVPFRQAHHAVGSLVALAEKLGVPLDRLDLAQLQSISSEFEADALRVFDLDRALDRRSITGAPGTNEVRKQLAWWKRNLQSLEKRTRRS